MLSLLHSVPKGECFMQTKLRDKTLELLIKSSERIKLVSIANDTGLEVRWLNLFKKGEIREPSVNKIETLYEHLSGKKLKI